MLHAVEDVPHRAVSIQSQLRSADATLEAVIADRRGAGDAKVRAICNGPAAGAQRNVLSAGEALHAHHDFQTRCSRLTLFSAFSVQQAYITRHLKD
jgi:hypothetical protein